MKELTVVIDAGHFLTTPGKRSPDGMREYEYNSAVANAMKAELKLYEGVNVYFAHDEKSDVPLKVRTDKANRLGADLYVSLQADAFNGVMGDHCGITTFLYPSAPAKTRQIAKVFQRNLIAATGLRDRGVKDKDLHVLRETHMDAILIEHGFMDSRTDLPKLKDTGYRKLCGVKNARSVAEVYGLKRKKAPVKKASMPNPSAKVWYDVVFDGFNQHEIDGAFAATKKAFPHWHMEKRKQ